ncbi:hypothetical protein DFQ28_002838 [Apophysomyces sp. BC1034]|nr:hypothetical protein DFQ30_005287 [Apophysomyces sp. BC1015]KAG0179402.1 hypothetical protein DFQ29_002123 [Apophysomyces sp. BC1021]KAG0189827.1 hypothetical protein DFQ28_002838 [Apophysomyces sp. BC1034]
MHRLVRSAPLRILTRSLSQTARIFEREAGLPRTASLDSVQSDSPYHFYQNKVIEQYVQQPINASTLRQYIFFGRQMNSDRLIKSANWVRNELLVRLAHRIRDFQQLPFFVGTNPHIEFVYRLYWGAFEKLRKQPTVETLRHNDAFCELLRDLLEDGQLVVPRMALGVSECASFYAKDKHDLDRFVNRMFRSRISRRVLAEQHLALTEACENDWDEMMGFGEGYVGIIFVRCSAKDVVGRATRLVEQQARQTYLPRYAPDQVAQHWTPPEVEVEIQHCARKGYQQAEDRNEIVFAYVPEQLEHILFELLSNAVRFTMAKHKKVYPPIRVTVSANETDVFFRVSDQGGGISQERFASLWSYQARAPSGEFLQFQAVQKMPTTISERADLGHVNLGMGLPMSRVYAEYWGGELQVVTMDGYGTDAYVRIPRLGTKAENVGLEKHAPASLDKAPTKAKSSHQHYRQSIEQHTVTSTTGDGWSHSDMIRT